MFQEQMNLYIRENGTMLLWILCGILFFMWLLLFIQVTRTSREVHRICKKIRKYFAVVMEEGQTETALEQKISAPTEKRTVNRENSEAEKQQAKRNEEDAKLLMEVIQEVF